MEIGGYFDLELAQGCNHLHEKAFASNTGRNALELILRELKVQKILLPYFTCDVILEPIHKLSIEIEWYNIDENLELKDFFPNLRDEEFILYTNYFGIKDRYISELSRIYQNNLIIDNAQSLFSDQLHNIPTFYSPRKFLGIPDGGYAYINKKINDMDYDIDYSYDRCLHLLKRLECDGSEGYADFKDNSIKLSKQPIKRMSELSKRMVASININKIKEKRIRNFSYLSNELNSLNRLSLDVDSFAVPMVYPLLIEDDGFREKLIKNRVFIATYWPNVLSQCDKGTLEYNLAKYILPLPIDQRYGESEMAHIVSFFK